MAAGLTIGGIPWVAAATIDAACPRQDIRFYQNWKFCLGDATGAEELTFSDNAWATVSLPHTVKLEDKLSSRGPAGYKGICWYRNSFTPDASYRGKKVFLEIQGAMQVADVWINGVKKTTFYGGYTPFRCRYTSDLEFGQINVIALRLDSRANSQVPPGTKVPDFMYFGGLYRNVFLARHGPPSCNRRAVRQCGKAGGGVF